MPIGIDTRIPPTAGTPETITYSRERWLWISPRGTTRELTGYVDSTEVVRGISGRYAPPVELVTQVVPEQPGAVVTGARHGVREFDLPLHATQTSVNGLRSVLASMAIDIDPVAGLGILRLVSTENVFADLFCRCVAGLAIDGEGGSGPVSQRTTLVFQAHDPYWYQQPVAATFTVGGAQSWFPILPLALGSSTVVGDVAIENEGDVEAWPVWTVTGPGADATLINNTTKETVAVRRDLAAGEQVVIDTRPDFSTIIGPNNANWRRYLTRRSLWPLMPGRNDVSLTMNSSTEDSRIGLIYRPRTLAP